MGGRLSWRQAENKQNKSQSNATGGELVYFPCALFFSSSSCALTFIYIYIHRERERERVSRKVAARLWLKKVARRKKKMAELENDEQGNAEGKHTATMTMTTTLTRAAVLG